MYYSLILVRNFSDFSNFTCEITKLPWQPYVCLGGNLLYVSVIHKNFINKDDGALKDALENLHIGKSTSRRILTNILLKYSENSELEPNLSCKRLRSRSS